MAGWWWRTAELWRISVVPYLMHFLLCIATGSQVLGHFCFAGKGANNPYWPQKMRGALWYWFILHYQQLFTYRHSSSTQTCTGRISIWWNARKQAVIINRSYELVCYIIRVVCILRVVEYNNILARVYAPPRISPAVYYDSYYYYIQYDSLVSYIVV